MLQSWKIVIFDRNLVCIMDFSKNKFIISPPVVEISIFVFLKPKHIICIYLDEYTQNLIIFIFIRHLKILYITLIKKLTAV